jgi:GDP-L-fucose synthase
VIAALIRKMHDAKMRGDGSITVWGTGSARREFIFVDDLADACIKVMREYSDEEPLNLGGGPVLSIGELAQAVRRVVGFAGRLEFDASKPDGMPMKALETSRLQRMGWQPQVAFDDALAATYQWYLDDAQARGHS